MEYPNWVLKHKQKGTEPRKIGDGYYLYKISSIWDKNFKRSRKITGDYLGTITKEGIIPPKHKRVLESYKQITVKEYGITSYMRSLSKDIEENLKKHYPYDHKEIFMMSVFRLVEQSPLKRFDFYYHNSYLSESVPDARMSTKFLGPFLRDIGSRRENMTEFMKEFVVGSEFAAIDLTEIFTFSKGVNAAMLGHNHKNAFVPQINMVLIFCLDKMQPGFFRMVPGSIRDISTLTGTINELGLKNTVIIGDKGFDSEDNVCALSDSELQYILPLKRNSSLIDYGVIKEGDRKEFDGVFQFEKRHIWHYSKTNGDEQIITFLDEKLKAEETTTLVSVVNHLKTKKKTDEIAKKINNFEMKLYEEDYKLGAITVRTNCDKSAEEVYGLLKSRMDIEKVFDIFKNILESDRNYMRDDKQLDGFLFVSFIALLMYYRVYAKLIEKKLLNQYSVLDVIEYLKRAHIMKIGKKFQFAEVPKKSRTLLKKLGVNFPDKPIP
ncbi:hypothetical protein BEH94_06825 [Candidatus Altiarchaeales archaeon WOR_SM1_SCG]|nr:hypothetical protein BEH94_06825 [Candidatus Altiarchaeales archaeon WOR_SM1_SCG]